MSLITDPGIGGWENPSRATYEVIVEVNKWLRKEKKKNYNKIVPFYTDTIVSAFLR